MILQRRPTNFLTEAAVVKLAQHFIIIINE